ncbi:MAG: O-antigen ligase C-terminal domain-containing protein [Comamonadaceae bacterium]|jgi:O-antigen ligase|nr:O-antigen ligase C-terminal domain-containing protein [Comamonadaceae bacterium]
MTLDSSANTARLTALAALTYALCWLLPNHHVPWTDFYSDAWAAGVLWLLAVVVLWRSRHAPALEWHALPLLALACGGIVWLQYAAGLIESLGVAFISTLYLAGLMLALLVGAAWERWKPGQCSDFLFFAVLFGASGSLLIQLQQWFRIDPGAAFWLFIPAPPSRFHANLGQPNQLASLLCLGVLACAWLHERKRMAGWVAWLWAALLAVGLALTESRTSWIVVLFSVAVLVVMRNRLAISRNLMGGALSWAGVFALCVAALPSANVLLGRAAALRPLRGISAGELRFEFWVKLWEALSLRPWSGYGWMQTSFAQFSPDPYAMVSDGTIRHAHNLVMDLGVELGIPLGLAVCTVLALWAIGAVRRVRQLQQLWMLLFVVALGVHAMLEFPLHYAYFLLPLGLMLGALNVSLQFKPVLSTRLWPAAVAVALASVGLVITVHDYVRIENDFFSLRFEHQKLEKSGGRTEPNVVALTHLQDMLWLARVDPSQTHTEQDLERALRTMKLLPSLMANYKLAAMYAFAGQPIQAEYWIVVMTLMNRPEERVVRDLRRQWDEQAMSYPPMALVGWPK